MVRCPNLLRPRVAVWMVSLLTVWQSSATAAPILGTTGNDLLFMAGQSQVMTTSLTNPYSGQTVVLNGTYFVDVADYYEGFSGSDTLFLTNESDLLIADLGGVQRIRSVERVIAGSGADVVNLASTTFTLGNTTIEGGQGDDVIWGNSGDDLLNGFSGDDVIDGGPGDDVINGQGDNDWLYGGDGNDTLDGGTGENWIFGGAGIDYLLLSAFSQYEVLQTGADSWLITALSLSVTRCPICHVSGVEYGVFGPETIAFSSLATTSTPVPEPASLLLLGTGLAIGAWRRR